MKEYTCAYCGETYAKIWTDNEAMEEFKEEFPEHIGAPLVTVCDDCYEEVCR